MHGMKNALNTIQEIDKEAPFPFKADQGTAFLFKMQILSVI